MLYATVRQRKIFVKKPTTIVQNGVNVDALTLEMDDEWAQMETIIALFTLKYTEEEGSPAILVGKEVSKEVPHTVGTPLMVPNECLEHTGRLMFSCTGYVSGEQIMTTMYPDSFWEVVPNGPMTGDAPLVASEWPGWSEYQLRNS